ncbi:MAG: hypothetical protein ACKVN8_03525 [Nitrosarchaeum sp.]
MLDKNPDQILDMELLHIKNEFSNKNPNIILCSEPFHKAEFLNIFINSIGYQVIFLDFDLLYTGYVVSEMIKNKNNVEIYHINKVDWTQKISEIAKRISNEKILLIIDSFNGFYNIFNEKESGRFVNASIMLLSSISKDSDSLVIITALARKNDKHEWILSPGGRHIINLKKSGTYHLKKMDDSLILSSLNQIETKQKIFKISSIDY